MREAADHLLTVDALIRLGPQDTVRTQTEGPLTRLRGPSGMCPTTEATEDSTG